MHLNEPWHGYRRKPYRIEPQNITINQDTKQILVTKPTSFLACFAHPVLTSSTTTVQSQAYSFDLLENSQAHSLTAITSGNKMNTYMFVLKPAGDLAFGSSSGSQSYSRSSQIMYICLPVYNFFDEELLSKVTVTLTHKSSGERIVLGITVFEWDSICDQQTRRGGAKPNKATVNTGDGTLIATTNQI